MDEKKEVQRMLVSNFFIMYSMMVVLIWIGLNVKFGRDLTVDDYWYILVNPLIMTSVMNFALRDRIKFENLDIDKSSLDYVKFLEFLKSKKVKAHGIENGSELYLVKNKHSFLPLKFTIMRTESNIRVVIPKVVIKEILKS